MKRARQGGDNALTCRLGVAFALATGSLIPVAPASAQTPAASTCVTAGCTSAQQGQLTSLLSPFTSLTRTNALSASFQTETGIYQSATYQQNANLPAVLTLIWQPNNNPSPLAANVLAALANSNVMNQVDNAFGVPNVASQATYLKSYSGFTTYTGFGQSGPYTLANIDPHPFQTNPAIWSNQWTNAPVPCPAGTTAANCPAAVQTAKWASDSASTTSGAFPSAHMIGGSLAALTYAGDGDAGRCATDAVHDLCVAPTRDGAVVGFAANTAVADGASVYLRYEGNVSGPDSAHALTAGVRVSW